MIVSLSVDVLLRRLTGQAELAKAAAIRVDQALRVDPA
jgi:hypothetical protein